MAYRKLNDGDLVRIVDVCSRYHGYDAVVIDAQKDYARVQLNSGRTDHLQPVCVDFPNRNLLVRDSVYYHIVDGRIDHDAKHKHYEKLRSELDKRNIVDSEPECPYAYWDREELIEKIKELEKQIEEIDEGNWL